MNIKININKELFAILPQEAYLRREKGQDLNSDKSNNNSSSYNNSHYKGILYQEDDNNQRGQIRYLA